MNEFYQLKVNQLQKNAMYSSIELLCKQHGHMFNIKIWNYDNKSILFYTVL